MSGLASSHMHIKLLAIGKVIEVRGSQIVAELDLDIIELSRVYEGEVYDIGQFGSILRIHFGRKTIFAMVNRLRMKAEYEMERIGRSDAQPDQRVLEADLIGEGRYISTASALGQPILRFERGISTYPLPLQTVYLTPKDELRAIYTGEHASPIEIGTYVGAEDSPCLLDLSELVGKHAAILGSTGTGKSACVAALLKGIMELGEGGDKDTWRPTVIVLDPHNEYARAFPQGCVLSPDDGTLSLPYWLMSLQETVELLTGRTEQAATAQASIIKDALAAGKHVTSQDDEETAGEITVDSPIPYNLDAFTEHIESEKPGTKTGQGPYNSVLEKLRILREDVRMSFMMSPESGANEPAGTDHVDALVSIMRSLLGDGRGPSIVDLSGVPSEVAGILTGTIARLLFSWRLWQSSEERERNPILLVCEEAHLYVPNRGNAQFAEAQQAVRRVVREGRKYGLSLIVVSQRPSEIDEAVLSQCNSWIVLRIGNDNDRERVRAALPESMAGLASVLSSLRRQEAVVLGQATTLPARIRIRTLAPSELPLSHDIDYLEGWSHGNADPAVMRRIARRWQTQGRDAQPLATGELP